MQGWWQGKLLEGLKQPWGPRGSMTPSGNPGAESFGAKFMIEALPEDAFPHKE